LFHLVPFVLGDGGDELMRGRQKLRRSQTFHFVEFEANASARVLLDVFDRVADIVAQFATEKNRSSRATGGATKMFLKLPVVGATKHTEIAKHVSTF
jgi:excinuclease UvrABC nuclease subunit